MEIKDKLVTHFSTKASVPPNVSIQSLTEVVVTFKLMETSRNSTFCAEPPSTQTLVVDFCDVKMLVG